MDLAPLRRGIFVLVIGRIGGVIGGGEDAAVGVGPVLVGGVGGKDYTIRAEVGEEGGREGEEPRFGGYGAVAGRR